MRKRHKWVEGQGSRGDQVCAECGLARTRVSNNRKARGASLGHHWEAWQLWKNDRNWIFPELSPRMGECEPEKQKALQAALTAQRAKGRA